MEKKLFWGGGCSKRLIHNHRTTPAAAAMPGADSQVQLLQQQTPPSVAVNGTPLTVAGKSYLVPTLRLPRGLSPEELRDGIKVRGGAVRCGVK